MIKIIALIMLIVSGSAFATGPECITFDSALLLSLRAQGGGALEEYQNRCRNTKTAIVEAQVRKVAFDCQKCFLDYSGRDRYAICIRKNDCAENNSTFFTFKNLSVVGMSPLTTSCSDAMICSEETQLCEYVCPDQFIYNLSSGFCERFCGDTEILQNNNCVTCPEGKISQNNVCVNECDVVGQTKESGACLCPSGQVIVNNECKSDSVNPCSEILPGSVPYAGSIWGGNAGTYPHDFFLNLISGTSSNSEIKIAGGIACRIPVSNRTVFNISLNNFAVSSSYQKYDLGTAPTTASIVIPHQFSYVGCFYDGFNSKSLMKVSSPAVPQNEAPVDGWSIEHSNLYMFCSDSMTPEFLRSYLDRWMDERSLFSGLSNQEYIVMQGQPVCYKYKPFVVEGGRIRSLGDKVYSLPEITLPYEDCSDCRRGQTKINGVCTCPSGMTDDAVNGCVRDVICKTKQEYESGLCSCPNGKPYLSNELKKSDGAGSYRCLSPEPNTALESTYNGGYQPNGTSGSFTLNECAGGDPSSASFSVTLNTNNSGANVYWRIRCAEKSPYPQSYGGSTYPVSTSDTFTGTLSSSSCYKYEAYAYTISYWGDTYTVVWKQTATLGYPKTCN
jgi:hypothetical protein